ncbi:uncharacterized protein IUM83_19928 [Phytophthora cinnamomi]|uniref:uncharacterized protein n=1 Tax=Phytophthora cinnamomi TaxID=4785 RepID=UPI0035599DD3|nr:hypothetical protein IUM83_19928 [Phytophthora cinnamomi]
MRDARREATRLTRIIERKDEQIADLIATHHQEKMALIQNLDTRMTELFNMHRRLAGELLSRENRVTTSPEGDKVHGFAMTIRPLRENGAHEIRLIAGQESYVSRQVERAPGTLFDFTETGNPIDLSQNFQREANARLRARIDAYLEANPSRKRKRQTSSFDAADLDGRKTKRSLSKRSPQS